MLNILRFVHNSINKTSLKLIKFTIQNNKIWSIMYIQNALSKILNITYLILKIKSK